MSDGNRDEADRERYGNARREWIVGGLSVGLLSPASSRLGSATASIASAGA
jgi:hypothetical protein